MFDRRRTNLRQALFCFWVCFVTLGSGVEGLSQGMVGGRAKGERSPLAHTDLPAPQVHFVDVADEAGLAFQHTSGPPKNKRYLLESTGAGVALFDFNKDGLLDVFLVNGSQWSFDPGEKRPTSRLFQNLGGLEFKDVTIEAGLKRTGWGQGACVGDFDNDGLDDLFVTYWGANTLYKNLGGGAFRDVTAEAGLESDDRRWSTGCAFLDYDRDGFLDLAVANYLKFDPENFPQPGDNPLCEYKGLPVMCGPRGLPGETNALYRNLGGGKFQDVSKSSGFTDPSGYYCFTVAPGDFNDDGWIDVYIACDSTPSILFRNNGDGTFTDIGISSGTAFNADGEEQGSMGAATGDYNRDGLLDIATTNFSEDTPTLYQNEGDEFFTDITVLAGLAEYTNFLGWGAGFVDVDHDGWKDLFFVNGHIYPNIDELKIRSSFHQRKNLYWNIRNGAFIDISDSSGPGVTSRRSGRGAAFGDLDNNGRLEVVINNLDSGPSLLVNRGEAKNWLLVEAQGTDSNRNAIGARVSLRSGDSSQTGEVQGACCYLSHSDFRVHFGLGERTKVDALEVRWPGGGREEFDVPGVNRIVTVKEGDGKAVTPVSASRRGE